MKKVNVTQKPIKKGRTIFIGDIHGCYDEFMLLLEKLDIKDEDRIFLTGDLLFKGPKSLKVLEYVYNNKEKIKTVKGNAEHGILEFLSGNFPNKDSWIIENEKLSKKLIKKPHLIEFIKSMPYFIEEKDFILIHAGFRETNPKLDILFLTGYDKKNFDKRWYEKYKGTKKVIYGHNAMWGLRIVGNTIGIDTGCANGAYLTAYTLETGEIIQQKAFKTYFKEKYDPKKY